MESHTVTTDCCPADCPDNCPGCARPHLDSRESLIQKTNWLKKTLCNWKDRIEPVETVSDDRRTGYRKDVALATRWSSEYGWQVCLVKKEIYYPVCRCPVHADTVRTSWALLSSVLPDPDRFPMAYYLQTGRQVALILKARTCPDKIKRKLTDAISNLKGKLPLDGVWLHCFPSVGKRLTAKPGWELIWGTPFSVDSDGLFYGPRTFRQAIADLHNKALLRVTKHLSPSASRPIIDLYCGRGVSLNRWQRLNAPAIGVEQGDEAVTCAKKNAPGAIIYKGACVHRLPQLSAHLKENAYRRSRVYVNPPRTGLEPPVCEWIIKECRPDRLCYLSCSAGTLNRDLGKLISGGFVVKKIIPYDFFPRTYHVETLVLLE